MGVGPGIWQKKLLVRMAGNKKTENMEEIIQMEKVNNGDRPRSAKKLQKKPSFFVEEGDEIIPLTILAANNEEVLPEDISVPPDGGWGWVIVFAAFMTSFILGGTLFTFGVLLTAILESVEEANILKPESVVDISVSTLAAVGGSLTACSLFSGPFAAALVNKIGFRVTALIGSVVASIGFVGSWYFCADGTPNVPALIVFYGLFGGTGTGLMYIPTIVTIGFYFEKKRALANGIANCGMGVGTCGFPPILAALIARFGWQRSLLAQAAFLLSCTLFAMLYRPLNPSKNSLGKQLEENTPETPDAEEDCTDGREYEIANTDVKRRHPRLQRVKTVDIDDIEEDNEDAEDEATDSRLNNAVFQEPEKPPPPSARKFVRLQSLGYMGAPRKGSMTPRPESALNRRISLAIPTARSHSLAATPRILRVDDRNTFNRPMHRNSIFYRGSINQIKEFQDANNIDLILANLKWEEDLEEVTTKEKPWYKKLASKLYVVRKMLDLSLMGSPVFLLVCVMAGLSLVGTAIPIVYLKGLSLERGFDQDASTLLISIFGISDMFGRIFAGGLATTVGNHVMFINNGALVIGGCVTILAPFSTTYPLLVIYAVAFGLASAAVQSLRSIILVELLGLHKLTNAIGLTLFCEGIATLFGSPFAGFLRDFTGTYDVSFYVGGALLLTAGIICSPIYMVKAFFDRRNQLQS